MDDGICCSCLSNPPRAGFTVFGLLCERLLSRLPSLEAFFSFARSRSLSLSLSRFRSLERSLSRPFERSFFLSLSRSLSLVFSLNLLFLDLDFDVLERERDLE